MSQPHVRTQTPEPWPEVIRKPPEPLSYTLGDILDQFVTTMIKLYMTQDEIHLAAKEHRDVPAETNRKLVDLNLARNRLKTGFERAIQGAVLTQYVFVDPRTKLAHGLEQGEDAG